MILEVKDLVKKYKRGEKEFYAVDHVSFSLEEGSFTVIMGESGCGKSTLFHLLTGMCRADGGTITFQEKDITRIGAKELAKLRSTDIGYILQGQNLLYNFNIGENICMPGYLGVMTPDMGAYAKWLLEEFGLGGMEKEMPGLLSGGEQRRVAIARTLVHRPKLIIADEPTSNLDSKNREIILDYLKKVSEKGVTVLISTHDREAGAYGDTIWHMEQGAISL